MEEIGHAMGASKVWRAALSPAFLERITKRTRMGNDPKTSVVNRYGQTWISQSFCDWQLDVSFDERLQSDAHIQALAYMSADAIAKRYKSRPGPLV